jgi:4-hydroxythreonine-4-phosphate dehydrogenase
MMPRVALSLGDPAGIGPEIALKAALDPRVLDICQPILVGDPAVLRRHARLCGLNPVLRTVDAVSAAAPPPADGEIVVLALEQFTTEPLRLGEINAANGNAAVEAARRAIEAALAGEVEAVVACPQTEAAIHAAGIAFDGYPSFVARCTGTAEEDAHLMLCFDDKRIVHTTLHVGLRRAIELVTEERVRRVIEVTHDTVQRLDGRAPRIAVSGLNPHASEGGLFGDEEAAIIAPAIAAAKAAGIQAEGPFGADTMFLRAGYDAFVVMFHDQGHITAKLLATNRTAGLTVGTPILFSSVAHGSALDIAGQNRASPEAVIAAIQRLVGRSPRPSEAAAE